jgi:hypothetical protein
LRRLSKRKNCKMNSETSILMISLTHRSVFDAEVSRMEFLGKHGNYGAENNAGISISFSHWD